MQFDGYLGPLESQPPAGVDLDESGELLGLDQMARWADPEAEPDWPALRDAAADALGRSRDLRVTVYLAAALLNAEGIRAFCGALGLLRNYLETLWDGVYPFLDGDDAIERSSAVFNLVNYHRVIRPLRRAPLVEDRAAGRFSLQDIEIAQGKIEPPADYEDEAPPQGMIIGAFQAMDGEELGALDSALGQGVEDLQEIEAAFQAHSGPSTVPDMSRLRDTLSEMRTFTSARLAERTGSSVPASGDDSVLQPVAAAEAQGTTGAAPTAVRSRQEAIRALDAVIRYFNNHEPSSPVPLLLERAKRLVDRDFMAILEELAPDALTQVRTISGKSGED
ncbi:type VI secretion system protein TssA [Arhodomonas sp. SL1]|uniref:type VI secretion system protein TssA n=1 Tax=Arhodomonas sp. SL1 TaxID=3425691 RepID=UPI003F88200F